MNNFLVRSPIKDMLVGKALGDGAVTTGIRGVGFKIENSINQQEYVNHQWEIQHKAGFVEHQVRTYHRKNKEGKILSTSISFVTGQRPEFEEFREFVVTMRPIIKGFPLNLEELQTPIALSYWIMDDGQAPSIDKDGVVKQGVTICTDSYTQDQVSFLKGILIRKFGLVVTTHKKGKNLRLAFGLNSMEKLREWTQPYLIPSMQYKVRIL